MAAACSKALLIILNLFFMVLSLVCIALGVILVFMVDVVAKEPFDKAKESSASSGYVITGEASDLKDFPLLFEAGVALLVFGSVLLCVSFLGSCTACCSTCCRTFLVVYAVIVVLLIVGETILFTLFLLKDSSLHTSIKDEIQERIKSDFDETTGNTFTSAMVIIHREGCCCGMEGEEDFGIKQHLSCCSNASGCYDKMQNTIEDNILYAGLAVGGFLFLQLIEIICAIKIFSSEKEKIHPF